MLGTLAFQLPEDLVAELSVGGRDLQRAAFEAFAVEEYRAKRLSHAQMGELLGLSRWDVDGLLKDHQVWLEYTVDDFRSEGEAIRKVNALRGYC
jgi:predicted HTH domain antitoxin